MRGGGREGGREDVPVADFVVFGVVAVQVTFDCVSAVVEQENDRRDTRANHR